MASSTSTLSPKMRRRADELLEVHAQPPRMSLMSAGTCRIRRRVHVSERESPVAGVADDGRA
jgi:hypothetical protein